MSTPTKLVSDDAAKRVISKNIRDALALREWSQKQLAEATGESTARINHAVRGRSVPSSAFLQRIALALQLTTDELLREPDEILENRA